ncbi:MAG: hypothetical protein KAI83_02520 [Thiomargarita sp.]|nr:hypothetical protein [Thiomargarita sp.]
MLSSLMVSSQSFDERPIVNADFCSCACVIVKWIACPCLLMPDSIQSV